jgi:hypothetical protein
MSAVSSLKRTNSDKVLITDLPDVRRRQREKSLSPPRRGHEFNFHRVRRVDFDNRTQVTSPKSSSRDIVRESNRVEKLVHETYPGYAVMNRGAPLFERSSHIDTTYPLRPFGPTRVPLTSYFCP